MRGFCVGVAGFIPRHCPKQKIRRYCSFLSHRTTAQTEVCYSIGMIDAYLVFC